MNADAIGAVLLLAAAIGAFAWYLLRHVPRQPSRRRLAQQAADEAITERLAALSAGAFPAMDSTARANLRARVISKALAERLEKR